MAAQTLPTATPPEAQPKSIPGFDINAIDKRIDPCVNFYQYACGNWIANNPIPADQPAWGRFNDLAERNRSALKAILEELAAKPGSGVDKQLGDYYATCMDEAGIEKRGTAPLKPELDRINAMTDRSTVVAEIARLHSRGVNIFFNFSSGQDFKDSTKVIAQADQGGLGLPDRDYYLKDDAKSVETRKQYAAHVQRMFELMGDNAAVAAKKAATVMRVETALAKGSLDRVARRDPAQVYHKMAVKELAAISPSFDWNLYLKTIGTPPVNDLNVAVPEFFKAMEGLATQVDLDDTKTYLTWHYVHEMAPLLPKKFVDENFAFYGKVLTGQQEQRPRWKRCVAMTDNQLGEALGQKFVEKTFGTEGKDRTLALVNNLEQALAMDVKSLDWMTPATKDQALTKLHAIANKIGYPEKYRDYSSVVVTRGDAIGNSERADAFEVKRQLNKIGQKVDPQEWFMTPPTVNAYYDPQMNNINFPAGILQPPFFEGKQDDAVNYGAIGAVIGHELTHGFDDEGRQFDPKGNLRDWWTEADAKAFEQRADCLVQQYGAYKAESGDNLNGKLTLGENTADNGGVRIAYMALMSALGNRTVAPKDGYTPQQRFFLGYAQVWCGNVRPEMARQLVQTDPHSPGQFRVNGVVANTPEFRQAFGCKLGQPMAPEKACRVW